MQDAMILHICSAAEWQASHDDHYRCASLDHEGFIHCSRPEQVVEVAGRLFQGRRDLVLLVIDPELVTADIRSEDGGNGNYYPHVYGPLNVSAVTSAYALALAQGLGLRYCARRRQISTLDGQVNTWCHVFISGN